MLVSTCQIEHNLKQLLFGFIWELIIVTSSLMKDIQTTRQIYVKQMLCQWFIVWGSMKQVTTFNGIQMSLLPMFPIYTFATLLLVRVLGLQEMPFDQGVVPMICHCAPHSHVYFYVATTFFVMGQGLMGFRIWFFMKWVCSIITSN